MATRDQLLGDLALRSAKLFFGTAVLRIGRYVVAFAGNQNS